MHHEGSARITSREMLLDNNIEKVECMDIVLPECGTLAVLESLTKPNRLLVFSWLLEYHR